MFHTRGPYSSCLVDTQPLSCSSCVSRVKTSAGEGENIIARKAEKSIRGYYLWRICNSGGYSCKVHYAVSR